MFRYEVKTLFESRFWRRNRHTFPTSLNSGARGGKRKFSTVPRFVVSGRRATGSTWADRQNSPHRRRAAESTAAAAAARNATLAELVNRYNVWKATILSEAMTDRSEWLPLSPALRRAVRRYECASRARLLARDARDAVTAPLYHYTDAGGLKGIIEAQQVWFTHFEHLNDPTEMKFGMILAKKCIVEVGKMCGPKVQIFCDMVDDLFSTENIHNIFAFYVASFTRLRNCSRGWREDGGCGAGQDVSQGVDGDTSAHPAERG